MAAVILAAGRGSRLRREDSAAALSQAQEAIADQGTKALMPVGRPFLDYTLHALAEVGVREVCLVVRPGREPIRPRYEALPKTRLSFRFAVQRQPRGTADAVAAAREAVGDRSFLVLNSDTYYPPGLLAKLVALPGPGLVALDARAVLARGVGNLDEERLLRFARVRRHGDGRLKSLEEAPPPDRRPRAEEDWLVSVNAWRFDPSLFAACAEVEPSPRGELELPAAVSLAMIRGASFQVEVSFEAILDLTSRRDVAVVTRALEGVEVRL